MVLWILQYRVSFFVFFFFNDTATTEIYTLSLHDALPISIRDDRLAAIGCRVDDRAVGLHGGADRKSTRLNSSHSQISYAVFCLKKKNTYTCHPCTHNRRAPHPHSAWPISARHRPRPPRPA